MITILCIGFMSACVVYGCQAKVKSKYVLFYKASYYLCVWRGQFMSQKPVCVTRSVFRHVFIERWWQIWLKRTDLLMSNKGQKYFETWYGIAKKSSAIKCQRVHFEDMKFHAPLHILYECLPAMLLSGKKREYNKLVLDTIVHDSIT